MLGEDKLPHSSEIINKKLFFKHTHAGTPPKDVGESEVLQIEESIFLKKKKSTMSLTPKDDSLYYYT